MPSKLCLLALSLLIVSLLDTCYAPKPKKDHANSLKSHANPPKDHTEKATGTKAVPPKKDDEIAKALAGAQDKSPHGRAVIAVTMAAKVKVPKMHNKVKASKERALHDMALYNVKKYMHDFEPTELNLAQVLNEVFTKNADFHKLGLKWEVKPGQAYSSAMKVAKAKADKTGDTLALAIIKVAMHFEAEKLAKEGHSKPNAKPPVVQMKESVMAALKKHDLKTFKSHDEAHIVQLMKSAADFDEHVKKLKLDWSHISPKEANKKVENENKKAIEADKKKERQVKVAPLNAKLQAAQQERLPKKVKNSKTFKALLPAKQEAVVEEEAFKDEDVSMPLDDGIDDMDMGQNDEIKSDRVVEEVEEDRISVENDQFNEEDPSENNPLPTKDDEEEKFVASAQEDQFDDDRKQNVVKGASDEDEVKDIEKAEQNEEKSTAFEDDQAKDPEMEEKQFDE